MTTSLPTHVNFITAGLGGIIGWTVVHPFNTLSVRRNLSFVELADNPSLGKLSFRQFTFHLIKNEGIPALYRGITAGWTRQVFYSTSVFGFFELFRDKIANHFEVTIVSRTLAGIGSGAVAALLSCPAEVSLVRISNDNALPVSKRRNYRGITDAFFRIYQEEGFQAFFRGVQPFVARAVMVGAVQIATYDHFRELYRKEYNIIEPAKNVFAAAMTSGLLYSFITMPLETVKNRMAFQRADNVTGQLPYTSIPQTFKQIIGKEGIRGLWSGYLPYYLRCGLHTLVMFSSIEFLRQQYSRATASPSSKA